MNPNKKLAGLINRVRAWEPRTRSRARREHDLAMGDPRVALEHQIQIGRAGRSCTFCN